MNSSIPFMLCAVLKLKTCEITEISSETCIQWNDWILSYKVTCRFEHVISLVICQASYQPPTTRTHHTTPSLSRKVNYSSCVYLQIVIGTIDPDFGCRVSWKVHHFSETQDLNMSSFAPTSSDDSAGNDSKYRAFDAPGAEFFEGRVNRFNILLIDIFKEYVLSSSDV